MSWINSSGRQQQQGPPPASTASNNNVTTPIMAQTSSATFNQQQWQPHNKQDFQQQQQQHPPPISTLNQSNPNSNWLSSNPITTTTTTLGATNSSQYQHINWQQQDLSSQPTQVHQSMVPIQQSNNPSFLTKQQSQSNVQQLTDNNQFFNYQQQQQYQQNFPGQLPQTQNQQFQQNYQQSSSAVGKSLVQNNQLKVEKMSTIKNQQDSDDKGPFSVRANDGWDDWDWNDNNQNVQNQTENRNIIDESFKTEPNDNWQWDVEEKPSVSNLQVNQQPLSPVQHQQYSVDKKSEASIKLRESDSENTSQVSPLGFKSLPNTEEQNIKSTAAVLSNFNQSTSLTPNAYGSHHAFIQTSRPNPVQQTVHSSPVNQHQRNVQILDSSVDNNNCQQQQQQQNTLSNAVYVSQAKPVSQPTRQYAMSPPLAINQPTSVNSPNLSINPPPSNQPPIVSNRKSSLSKLQNNAALPPYPANSQSPGNGNFPLPPPPSQTPPEQNSNFNSSTFPPPPPINLTNLANSNNPYKRAGQVQHHRNFISGAAKSQPKVPVMPSQFFAPPPEDFRNAPPPKDFQNAPSPKDCQNQSEQNLGINQECLSPDNSEVVDRNFEIENFEIAPHTPNDDRNQYLQTSHLSEEDFSSNRIDENNRQESNYENDNFPPPGLSRLVLGQPEIDPQQNSVILSEIPPGLDRMIPGTELATSDLNMERQADGQDTMPSPRSAFSNVPLVESSSIDITSDRNLYLVAGESDVHEQRVVTGVENGSLNQSTEQRELVMDGENLEDQQQQQQQHDFVDISRDEPIEGANTLDAVVGSQNINHETESSLTLETNVKDHSNVSTGNEESDNREKQLSYFGKTQKRVEEKKRRNGGNEQETHKRRGRYETEDSDLSSDKERRRYKEGNSRNERDKGRDSKEKERRDREKREGSVRDIDRGRYREEEEREDRRFDRERNRSKHDKDQDRGSRYGGTRYETDSKYETEGSIRYERRRGERDRDRDRNKDYERDYDRDDSDYRKSEERDRRYYRRDDRDSRDRDRERDRESKRRGDDEEYYLDERRQKRRNRDRVRDRDRDRDRERDYRDRRDRGSNYDDEYNRKGGSRNARDNDRDKERTRDKDSRYSHMYGYPSTYGYDPYAYYQQQQQYFEQLRRTNPQVYAEWYRKYFGGHQIQSDLIGGTAPTTDGRESVHSGRSSANDKQERYSLQSFHPYFQQQHTPSDYHRQQYGQHHALNSSMQQYNNEDQHSVNLNDGLYQQHQQHLLHSNRSYSNYMLPPSGGRSSYYAPSDCSESRPDNLSINLIDGASVTTTQDPQRLTPCKFVSEHAIASLSAGIMVCVKPKYVQNGGITNIVKILKIGANDSTRRLFQTFPGPLVRGLTHKKTIIEFCEDQIRLGPSLTTIRSRQNSSSSVCSLGQANKASFTLMWNLLILLLRQNGMVVGTDIAELLMKNKQQFPYEILVKTQLNNRENSVQSNSRKSNESDEENDDNDNDNSNSTNEKDDQNSEESDSKISLSEEEITEKFRNYLLYGNVNEALDWATENNLWGHALFLASKVDRRLHANVMMKFANKLSLNDPLQTLYQLMSGRTPSSVTSVQDEKWGDWRPHLAMILSNTSQRPELDRKAITTLGDSLYNRGDLFGAQFCYLMAQVGFNKYSAVNHDSTLMSNSANVVRLVLLGSSQHKPFKEFATNEAIMMTEIYEYACALNDDKFCITEFQPYKYLLATRMLDYGLQLKTLMYMEQISLHIQRDPSKYDPKFIEKVYNLGDRLKFCDPVLEKTMDDQNNVESNLQLGGGNVQVQDQKWLQDLKDISKQYCTENHLLNETEHTMISGQKGVMNPVLDNNRSQIDQQFVEINQQFSELNMQYNNFDPSQSITSSQIQQQQQNTQFKQQQQQQHQFQIQGQDINQQVVDQYNQFYNPSSLSSNQQKQSYDSLQSKNEDMISGYGEMNFVQSYDQQQQQQQQQDFHNENNQQMASAYDYWNQQQQQQQENEQEEMTQRVSPLPLPSSIDTSSITELANSVISNHETAIKFVVNSNKNSPYNQKHENLSKNNLTITNKYSSSSSTEKLEETKDSHLSPLLPLKMDNNQLQKSVVTTLEATSYHDRQDPTLQDAPRPTISMPNSISNKPGFYDDTQNDDSNIRSSSNQQQSLTTGKLDISSDSRKNTIPPSSGTVTSSKTDNKNQNKSSNQSNTNSGWFGGIWNKLSLKPKNQMILPDDKNPTIVWDPEKKKWVNTEAEEDEQENFKPPPKMSDLMQTANTVPQSNYQNQNQNPSPPPPPLTSSLSSSSSTFQQTSSTHFQPSQSVQHQSPSIPTSQSVPLMNLSNPMSAAGASGINESTNKIPSLQSNMFKMQRNRTLKKSYVDVFNPSSASSSSSKPSVEPVLAPVLPPVNVPQSGFFVPAASTDDTHQQQPSQENVPQFYNPNQFSGY